jgi:hypothetical protein
MASFRPETFTKIWDSGANFAPRGSAETLGKAAKAPKCRRFPKNSETCTRDRTGWLGREDSNLRMAESDAGEQRWECSPQPGRSPRLFHTCETCGMNNRPAPQAREKSRSGPILAVIGAKPGALASALPRLYWPCAARLRPVTIRGGRYSRLQPSYPLCQTGHGLDTGINRRAIRNHLKWKNRRVAACNRRRLIRLQAPKGACLSRKCCAGVAPRTPFSEYVLGSALRFSEPENENIKGM